MTVDMAQTNWGNSGNFTTIQPFKEQRFRNLLNSEKIHVSLKVPWMANVLATLWGVVLNFDKGLKRPHIVQVHMEIIRIGVDITFCDIDSLFTESNFVHKWVPTKYWGNTFYYDYFICISSFTCKLQLSTSFYRFYAWMLNNII